jgi:uncharacterized membrane protein YdbT with pleckstrin-like domain
MLPYLLFGGLLAATGLWLAWWQQASSQAAEEELAASEENREEAAVSQDREFLRGQHRRRMTMALLVIAVGAAIAAGRLIADPLWLGIYWLLVILVVLAIVVLAGFDFYAGREHYLNLSQELKVQETRLRQEVRKLRQRSDRNGHE